MQKILVYPSEHLYAQVAETWIELAGQAISDHEYFFVSLAGGATPKKLYQLLAMPEYRERIDWGKVHIYFGDERCVPREHIDSNFRMAMDTFLSGLPLPEANIHGVEIKIGDPNSSAANYAQSFSLLPKNENGVPVFDLMLLGIGNDGHTASLFPGSSILEEQSEWVRAVYVEKLDSWRVSVTFPVINASKVVLFLVAGETKADILADLFADEKQTKNLDPYPVQRVETTADNEVLWYLDEAAARNLPQSLPNLQS